MSTPTGPMLAPGETLTVTAAPLPDSPWVAGNSPDVVDRIKGLQSKWGANPDGKFGTGTLSAAEAYTIPSSPSQSVVLGSSTPPSGVNPVTIEKNTQALEKSLGSTLGGHRSYMNSWSVTGMTGVDGMATIIANDLAADRSVYTSMKPPGGSWAGWKDIIANTPGVQAVEDAIAKALQKCDGHGLVHLYTLHHEYENDRDLSGLTATQKQAHRDQGYDAQCLHYDRLRKRGIPDNVLMGPTMMNYTLTGQGAAKYGETKLWIQGSDYFNFMGFDDYPTTWDDNWAFAQSLGLPIAFGEFGQSLSASGGTKDTFPQLQAQYLEGRLAWLNAHRGPGLIGAWWWNSVHMEAPALAVMGKAMNAERGLLKPVR